MKLTCPVCCSPDVNQYHDKVWSRKNTLVMRCHSCKLAFIHPMMSEEEERQFYADYNQHVQARGVTVNSSPEEMHQKSIPVALERYDVVGHHFNRGKSVLEIGAATGSFLQLLKKSHCSCVEPAIDNREYCRQFVEEIFADVSEIPPSRRYDIICMFHVFEHIRTPVQFLKQCTQLLNPGGMIIIEVPCIEDPLLTLYHLDAFKDFYFQPMHPFIYSEQALDFCFQQAGLNKKKVMYYQRYGLDNHLAWLKNKKPGGDIELQKMFADNQEYKQQLVSAKKTDTLFYFAATSAKEK